MDEANRRTCVIPAPRVLTDGELYRTIRRELLRRGGTPLEQDVTLTLTVTSSGSTIASATELDRQTEPPSMAVLKLKEPDHFSFPPGPLG